MKIILLIVLVAATGVFADTFQCSGNSFVCKMKEVGHTISHHVSSLGSKLKDVGSNIVSSALESGKKLLLDGAHSVVQAVYDHLKSQGIIGKREIPFFNKIKGHVQNGIEMAKKAKEAINAAFNKVVDKLSGAAKKIAGLKDVEQTADKEIDQAVDEFNKEGKKGFFALASGIYKKFEEIFKAGVQKLKDMYAKKTSTAVQKRGVLSSLQSAWEKAKGHLSNVASTLGDAFKPHYDNLKEGVKSLADTLKGHATNLVNNAKDSLKQLGDKLSTHVDTLKGHVGKLGEHATNAVNALKEAIANVATQTVANVKDTAGKILDTGKDAAGVVTGHVAGAVSGSN